MVAYIDTSILAAYYFPEPLSALATRELQHLDQRLISPLVELELISALAMKTRTKDLSTASAKMILGKFKSHISQGLFELVDIEAKEYATASAWLADFTTSLRAPDALHLAAAFVRGTTLLTADSTLARSATTLGVKCKLIRLG